MFTAVVCLSSPIHSAFAGYVHGYTKSNGTYVNGYYRSNPDGNPYNNYSYPGNTNPYTGETAGGNASTYLNNYYNSSGYSYSPTPSCPANSYSFGSSCKCNYGYVVNGGSCVNANMLCQNKMGLMSNYDSLSQTCKCDYGYSPDNFGTCTYTSSSYSYPTYSATNYSNINSCPAHSSTSLTDSTRCTCDTGYKVNSDKTKCVLTTSRDNDKMCRASFGSKSKWNGEYKKETNTPYCACKDNYAWNTDQTSCIKI